MQISHSRIETYTRCPYKFKLRYVAGWDTLPSDDPASPLNLGSALHLGLEHDTKTAINYYYKQYPVINDKHINETIKLQYWINKAKTLLPAGDHEIKLENNDFIGFVDLLVPIDGNTYDLYDFKYSNNIESYLESGQLHEYKYFYEIINPTKTIRQLYFVFIPKSNLRQKKSETLYEFRQRIINDMASKQIQIMAIEYNPKKVIEFLINAKHCLEDQTYNKNPGPLCRWCDYQAFCERGEDWMMVKKEVER